MIVDFFRQLRLVPIVLIASACLFVLKAADLALDGGYLTTAERVSADGEVAIVRAAPDVSQTSGPRRSWAQEMFNYPGASGVASNTSGPTPIPIMVPLAADKLGGGDITGSVTTDKHDTKAKPATASGMNGGKVANAEGPPNGTLIQSDMPLPHSARSAILERLQQRRQQLDTRARELDIREGLVAAAEKRVEARLAEINEVKAQISVATKKKSEAEAARFKGLVTMYENMKPRDAAKIFNRLEIDVLIEVASQINPRNMADILAQMSPDMAERLTVALANRAQSVGRGGPADLPKIEGRPTTQ